MNCNNHRHGTLTLKAMAVDPDGRDIDPETETQQIKALRDPSSKTYNETFADICTQMENDYTVIYRFNLVEADYISLKGNKIVYGNVGYEGKANGMGAMNINYTWGDSKKNRLYKDTRCFCFIRGSKSCRSVL